MEDNPELDSIDDYLIRVRDRTCLLRVAAENLRAAGLMPGDIIVLEKNAEPRPNDLVVALIGSDWIIDYFHHLPARAELTGVVVGSFRKYL